VKRGLVGKVVLWGKWIERRGGDRATGAKRITLPSVAPNGTSATVNVVESAGFSDQYPAPDRSVFRHIPDVPTKSEPFGSSSVGIATVLARARPAGGPHHPQDVGLGQQSVGQHFTPRPSSVECAHSTTLTSLRADRRACRVCSRMLRTHTIGTYPRTTCRCSR
jgi:hypothetical protein